MAGGISRGDRVGTPDGPGIVVGIVTHVEWEWRKPHREQRVLVELEGGPVRRYRGNEVHRLEVEASR